MFSNVNGHSGVYCSPAMSHPTQSGSLYWDGNSRTVAIVDGYGNKNTYHPVSQSISLEPRTLEAVNWAFKKMEAERNINDLCKQHPGLSELKEKYELMLALVSQES